MTTETVDSDDPGAPMFKGPYGWGVTIQRVYKHMARVRFNCGWPAFSIPRHMIERNGFRARRGAQILIDINPCAGPKVSRTKKRSGARR